MEEHIRRVVGIRDVSERRATLERAGLGEAEIAAILEQAHFRTKGRDKFPRAQQMRFDREGLAQASSKVVAEYRTWKIREQLGSIGRVVDACSGIGGDAIAMATRWPVTAIERDLETVEMLRHNLAVYDLSERVEVVCADLASYVSSESGRGRLSSADCVFFDPSRRARGSRRIRPEDYDPPLAFVSKLRALCPNVCVKVSPMLELEDLPEGCDREVVSHRGDVKEIVLWFGALKQRGDVGSVLATKLPERETRIRRDPRPAVAVRAPGRFLHEPDGAFAKAELVPEIAAELSLWRLSERVAYLSSDSPVDSPLVDSYRILDHLPVSYRAIGERLSKLGIGRLDFKARGLAIDLRNVHRKIESRGRKRGLVVFTRLGGEPRTLLCRYGAQA